MHPHYGSLAEADIPAFVQAVIGTGCDICAVGHVGYILGDVDLTPRDREATEPRLQEIDEMFGERDHLKPEIIAYLRSICRYIEI
ncbi:hypothetical protein G6N73_12940 [Mesorhizobium camelthorni]|uniref:Uncharacterized protein n=1 Tax=Allomesorhizobium camelthorni TaxID=475069 RepID=A0A6G4WBU9_9HYPH|nr:hypothetical protein [Mesorhizobium camelthorni]